MTEFTRSGVFAMIMYTTLAPEATRAEGISGADVQYLIEEEASLRQQLQERVRGLRLRTQNLANTIGRFDTFVQII